MERRSARRNLGNHSRTVRSNNHCSTDFTFVQGIQNAAYGAIGAGGHFAWPRNFGSARNPFGAGE